LIVPKARAKARAIFSGVVRMKITAEDAAVVKGMIARGDKQQWIIAWFGGWLNPGRISEIHTGRAGTIGETFKDVPPASREKLPPIGPYIMGRDIDQALLILGPIKAAIDRAYGLLQQRPNHEV
jgi:hypothetical protein